MGQSKLLDGGGLVPKYRKRPRGERSGCSEASTLAVGETEEEAASGQTWIKRVWEYVPGV